MNLEGTENDDNHYNQAKGKGYVGGSGAMQEVSEHVQLNGQSMTVHGKKQKFNTVT